MIEHFMDERPVIEGIAFRSGALLTILVLAPGTAIANDGCVLALRSDQRKHGEQVPPMLPCDEALAFARSKPPGTVTVVGMTEEQAERFIMSGELRVGGA
jgi:hypothetical protein